MFALHTLSNVYSLTVHRKALSLRGVKISVGKYEILASVVNREFSEIQQ